MGVWNIRGECLYLSPVPGRQFEVTLFPLSGKRLFVGNYNSATRIRIGRLIPGSGMLVLMINDGIARYRSRVLSIK